MKIIKHFLIFLMLLSSFTATAQQIYLADNGLTASPATGTTRKVQLGGPLTIPTTITVTAANKLIIAGGTTTGLGFQFSGLTNATATTINSNKALAFDASGNLVWVNVSTNFANGVTGTLGVANGGTGAATFTAGYLKASAATPFITVATIPGADLTNATVTYAKIQNVTAARLLGNPTAAAGAMSEITVGTGLNLSIAGVLTATGGGGAVSSIFGRTGVVVAATNDYTFAQIGSKPTTVAGYGITDAASLTHNHTLDGLSNVVTTGKLINDQLKWNGTNWVSFTPSGGGSSGWGLTGNAGTITGTNFIGTTDNVPLTIKVNNFRSGYIDLNLNASYGYSSFISNSSGINNTAVGALSMRDNTTGSWNTANGLQSLMTNTTGYWNTTIGGQTLMVNTTGFWNTALGGQALTNNISGYRNTGVGLQSLWGNSTGFLNTALGYASLFSANGNYNTALGTSAGLTITTGSNNIIVGPSTSGITTGNNNVLIGGNISSLNAALSNNIILADGQGNQRINVDANGNVGINTTDTKGYKFAVNGDVIFNRAIVKLYASWPDFVFEEKYGLLPLQQLAQYIRQNKHLPNIPGAKEVEANGIDLGSNQAALLQKIEELTLYIIQQQKQIDAQNKKINCLEQLQQQIDVLKKSVEAFKK